LLLVILLSPTVVTRFLLDFYQDPVAYTAF
jgi:hypothetical protein